MPANGYRDNGYLICKRAILWHGPTFLLLLFLVRYSLSQHHLPVGIEPDQYEQQNGKGDQCSSAIADEWKWYTNNRSKANGHANVYDNMKEENRNNAIGIATAEHTSLAFGYSYDPEKKQ